jgi:hypothetical protein
MPGVLPGIHDCFPKKTDVDRRANPAMTGKG